MRWHRWDLAVVLCFSFRGVRGGWVFTPTRHTRITPASRAHFRFSTTRLFHPHNLPMHRCSAVPEREPRRQ